VPPIEQRHRVLLIGDDQRIVEHIRSALRNSESSSFVVDYVTDLSVGLQQLTSGKFAAVLLQICFPNSTGIDSFLQVYDAAPNVPILVLAENTQKALAIKAVAAGARDYLLPGHLDRYCLSRALNHAIEWKVSQDQLYTEKDRALVTLNSIGDAVLCTDISGHITYLNLVAETMTGWPRKDAVGRRLAEVFHIVDGATRQMARDPLEMAVEENRTVGLTVNCILIRRDGVEFAIEDSAAPIHDRSGDVVGAVIVFHDVSAARAMSMEITYAAHHDLVTGLPNRLLLNDRICQAITMARRQHKFVALIFLDLDRFKNINDSLGHTVGDKLLQSVAKRLQACLRHSDTVSRQGGDEFVILLTLIEAPDEAARGAQKILHALSAPHLVEEQMLHISGSVGISIFPNDGETPELLIQAADTAMYHAKESGRDNFQFFTRKMNQKAVERQSLESNLRLALERKEFVLYYQPRVKINTGEIIGCEALIRWQQPDRGLLCPDQFVSVAEDSGLIIPIGRWVLREACLQGSKWQQAGLPPLSISVNISAVEFGNNSFIEGIRSIIAETGFEARYLELELTESVLMKDARSTVLALTRLKQMGINLAIDDFGTGYSSLSYLRQFPIDVLKIDRSFVQEITNEPDDSILISAIINMGKALKYSVLAEGIESEQQRLYLERHQCAEGQGYLFSRPLAEDEFADLLANTKS
jgi:diguanylate cyclase (GGDEF)-like protein/PAS domain S-box-containing protein